MEHPGLRPDGRSDRPFTAPLQRADRARGGDHDGRVHDDPAVALERSSTRALGAGLANTTALLEHPDCAHSGALAAAAGHTVVVGGVTYNDWYVPSLAELRLVKDVLSQLGTGDMTKTMFYWTSTFYDDVGVSTAPSDQGSASVLAQEKGGVLEINGLRPIRRF